MAYIYTDIVPGPTVTEYLADSPLEAVESDHRGSVYMYSCGCRVVRWIAAVDCYVRWCEDHRPRIKRG